MIVHYALQAESHTKRCADYVLAMATLRIVPIDVIHDEEKGIIKWIFSTHKDVYDVVKWVSHMTPDI